MPTTKRRSQDPKRVSSQKYEVEYAAGRVASETRSPRSKARSAVKTAKKQLGRSTARRKVMSRAKKVAAR